MRQTLYEETVLRVHKLYEQQRKQLVELRECAIAHPEDYTTPEGHGESLAHLTDAIRLLDDGQARVMEHLGVGVTLAPSDNDRLPGELFKLEQS